MQDILYDFNETKEIVFEILAEEMEEKERKKGQRKK